MWRRRMRVRKRADRIQTEPHDEQPKQHRNQRKRDEPTQQYILKNRHFCIEYFCKYGLVAFRSFEVDYNHHLVEKPIHAHSQTTKASQKHTHTMTMSMWPWLVSNEICKEPCQSHINTINVSAVHIQAAKYKEYNVALLQLQKLIIWILSRSKLYSSRDLPRRILATLLPV